MLTKECVFFHLDKSEGPVFMRRVEPLDRRDHTTVVYLAVEENLGWSRLIMNYFSLLIYYSSIYLFIFAALIYLAMEENLGWSRFIVSAISVGAAVVEFVI